MDLSCGHRGRTAALKRWLCLLASAVALAASEPARAAPVPEADPFDFMLLFPPIDDEPDTIERINRKLQDWLDDHEFEGAWIGVLV